MILHTQNRLLGRGAMSVPSRGLHGSWVLTVPEADRDQDGTEQYRYLAVRGNLRAALAIERM